MEREFGEMIRNLRIERHMTQEILSEGICSPSSLSRIENGSQVPSRKTFQLLMERLDAPGFSYAQCVSLEEYEREVLQEKTKEALQYWQLELAEELLYEMEHHKKRAGMKFCQMLELSKQIWMMKRGYPDEDYAERCINILQMGRPGLPITRYFQESEKDMRPIRDVLSGRRGDAVELLILNNIAVGYMRRAEYEKAFQILAVLLHQLGDSTRGKEWNWRAQCAVCNNLAICLWKLNRPKAALHYMNRAIRQGGRRGGVLLMLWLLRNRMEIYWMLEEMEEYEKDKMLVEKTRKRLPQKVQDKIEMEGLHYTGREILIF